MVQEQILSARHRTVVSRRHAGAGLTIMSAHSTQACGAISAPPAESRLPDVNTFSATRQSTMMQRRYSVLTVTTRLVVATSFATTCASTIRRQASRRMSTLAGKRKRPTGQLEKRQVTLAQQSCLSVRFQTLMAVLQTLSIVTLLFCLMKILSAITLLPTTW